MYKPTAKDRKILAQYQTCAYIYKDGIAIKERRQLRSGKFTEDIDIWHLRPCDIRISATNAREDGGAIGRIVVHDAKTLIDGLAAIEVYFNNCSERMKELGQTCDTLKLVTPAGAEHDTDIFSFMAADFTIQTDIDPDNLEAVRISLEADYAKIA